MPLQDGTEPHHVRQKHLGMFGGFGGIERVRQFQAEKFQVLQRLAAAVGTVDITQSVNVEITRRVPGAHIDGKNIIERKFSFNPLGKKQVRAFGRMRRIGVFLVLMQDQAADIIERESQAAMQPSFLFQAFFNQPRVNQLANQRRR
ncbi:MAG: hypothetical protein BWX99_02557 [Deltaproteobacteria bacterium ADurb.Bin151]|nr:MAG: hypothetical protein BWX99_02557 [Deltaproteobacteria bacterium ADurb.Bin151]